MKLLYGVFFVSSCLVGHYEGAINFKAAREGHRGTTLDANQIKKVAEVEDSANFQSLLHPIMVPRVVGTDSHENVKNYLIKTMQDLGWQVEEDSFYAPTPIGKLQFQNVVARLNPRADRFLTLACHYDSKYMREGSFIGATDSAVPCAMMLHLAATLDPFLKANAQEQSTLSLKLIFFDGEEAFNQWGPNDSIYGARHLARKLQKTAYPDGGGKSTHLDRMDMMVLLDLIGVSEPSFYSYFSNTDGWYRRLVNAENKLAEMRLLAQYSIGLDGYPRHRYFNPQSVQAGIEDDHIPFLRRGVPILHLIPSPFPDVWHKPSDNYAALDFKTIADLNKIIRIFVAEYMSLKI